MKRNFLLLLLITVFSGLAKAQDSAKVTYGIKLGISTNSTTRTAASSIKMNSFNSFSASVVVDVPLINVLSVQPALTWSKKGQEKYSTISKTTTQYKVTYLTLPVNFVYKFKNFFGGAGPYGAYALGGTKKEGSNKTDIRFGKTYEAADSKRNDEWEDYDYGVNFLLGYKLKSFTFSVDYGLGMKDVEPGPYSSKIRVGTFAVGLMF